MAAAASVGGKRFDVLLALILNELVEKIVKDTLKEMRHLSSSDFEDLVGVKPQIEQIESLLCIGEDVRIIGIWGMGGIGKPTIAKAVFNKLSSHFEAKCFLENVKEALSTRQGLIHIYYELVTPLFDGGTTGILNLNSLMSCLRHKQVFIVVADVDNLEQLESYSWKILFAWCGK